MLTVFIVDYIDNCRRNDRENSYEAVGELYKKMKNICEEMQLVGWTASQPKISEWDTNEDAGLSSLAESSMKQHIIDGMITMRKISETQYSMYVPKLRRGRSDFTVDLLLDFSRMFIRESRVSRAPVTNSSNSQSITTVNNYTSSSAQAPQAAQSPF